MKLHHRKALLLLMTVHGLVTPAVATSELEAGIALYEQGLYEKCVPSLSTAVAGPEINNPIAHFYLANAYLKTNQPTLALAEYDKVWHLSPKSPAGKASLQMLPSLSKYAYTKDSGFIGIKLSGDHVVTVFPDSPAAQAGLHDGDIIIAVDGQSFSELNPVSAVRLILGPVDTVVELKFKRDGNESVVRIKRASCPPAEQDEVQRMQRRP